MIIYLPAKGELGDTRLWELLELLHLRDLVAVGGLEAKVHNHDDGGGDEDMDVHGDCNDFQRWEDVTANVHCDEL